MRRAHSTSRRPRAVRVPAPGPLALALVLLAGALCVRSAQAAPPAAGSASKARPGAAKATEAGRRVAPRGHPQKVGPAPDSGGAGRSRSGPRTLDDIHIEGEIPVPQVLFITARDQRRFLEFRHHQYQRSSRELSRATPIPSRLVVTAPQPVEKKENPR